MTVPVFRERLRHWGALPEHAMRREQVDRYFSVVSPATAAVAIEVLLVQLRQRSEAAARVYLAWVEWMDRAERLGVDLGAWLEAARAQGLPEVADLLQDTPAARSLEPDAELPPPHPDMADLTLGEKKARARRILPQDLHKFYTESHPHVLEILFSHPVMTQGQMVRFLSRRPLQPQAVAVVLQSPRWLRDRAVQRALVFNPWTPGRIALRLLPLLLPEEWREVLAARDLPEALRRHARRLLMLGTAEGIAPLPQVPG